MSAFGPTSPHALCADVLYVWSPSVRALFHVIWERNCGVMSERAEDADDATEKDGGKSWTSFFVVGCSTSVLRVPSVVNYAKCLVYTPSTAAVHDDAAARHNMLYDFISIHGPNITHYLQRGYSASALFVETV